MNRKDFLVRSGVFTGAAMWAPSLMATPMQPAGADIQPVLLPPLPPLEHGGSMGIRTRIYSTMTNGVYSSVECAVAPKNMGPPPHMHKELDELMFVTEGTAHVLIGNDVVKVEAGGWHLRPRMMKHTFWNAGEQDLRFIDMYFHQPFEKYLEKIFFDLNEANGFPEGSEAKMNAINQLNDEFGVLFGDDSWSERQRIVAEFKLK
ncbi:MAG: cupin domain-containing protein [Flavobacteriales bacterium]